MVRNFKKIVSVYVEVIVKRTTHAGEETTVQVVKVHPVVVPLEGANEEIDNEATLEEAKLIWVNNYLKYESNYSPIRNYSAVGKLLPYLEITAKLIPEKEKNTIEIHKNTLESCE